MNVKPKVLIVDDEERFRSTMRKLLLAEGLEASYLWKRNPGIGRIAQESL